MIQLYYTYYESPIGLISIGGTEEYISELLFIDNAEEMSHGEPGITEVIHQCTEELIEYFHGKRKDFQVPIFQEGTEFQEQVWNQLVHIPYGKTISYLQLAEQIGDSKATRAVAAANGKNKIMLLRPCHRVIGSDRSLTGYAGGTWRKKWLLQHEFKTNLGVQTLF
ncbi:MAG: methylated-DNA--[protein]-cysteine S-methyltransferase [Chitinophagia bacterium]|nr:methylated-DNA--[protein]-cysteine S-methyltransferase [Chitinophagia bacterium]